jgi:chemotaxis protein MotA
VKAITGISIAACFGVLFLAVTLEGGNPFAFMNIPAALIVIGGTACATMASTDAAKAFALPKLAILASKGASFDATAAVGQMVGLAEKARREGLLALESDLEAIEDPYTRKGMQLVIDGGDSDLVRGILQSESDAMAQRHSAHAKLFATAGGFAPTLGILGTVMSLVFVLENLDKPETLGHAIAGAFIATLYGVGSANLVFLPIGNKLKEMSHAEQHHRALLLEAILSIQAGDNPRMLAEKLETFVPPKERGKQADTPKERPAEESSEDAVPEAA